MLNLGQIAVSQHLKFCLNDRTSGLLGLGQIGSRVPGVGKIFDMDIISWSQTPTRERQGE